MAALSTHVLDTSRGEPAQRLRVDLRSAAADTVLDMAFTDEDGRVKAFDAAELRPGKYTLTFHSGAYFEASQTAHFFPLITITFTVPDGPAAHYHVPLLLSPFAYSTYRGS